MVESDSEQRKAILDSISKHPLSRFAKLFHEVDEAPNQKNIVLLLMELVQQKDFYVDFNISLQYFLNLYEKLDAINKEFLFNEAGLLIHSATQVFCRRVDCVQQRMEDQLAALSSGQESKEKSGDETTANAVKEKPNRRKRLVEINDSSEIEVVSRKFRKIAPEKRFATGTKLDTKKLFEQNLHVETYTHPALWQHSEIIDLDNDEDFDSKRNYRLFTSHLEHRYNTLVPDINFRLYFKVKDYMDEEDERDNEHENCLNSDWPPLSQAYIRRYIDLEDHVLGNHKENFAGKARRKNNDEIFCSESIDLSKLRIDSCIISNCLETNKEKTSSVDPKVVKEQVEKLHPGSNEKTNICEENLINSEENMKNTTEKSLIESGIGSSLCQSSINSTSILCQEQSHDAIESEQFQKETLSEINEKAESTNETHENALSSDEDPVRLEAVCPTEVEQSISESIINEMASSAVNSTMTNKIDLQELGEEIPKNDQSDLIAVPAKGDVTSPVRLQEAEKDMERNVLREREDDESLEIAIQLESKNNGICVSTEFCPSISPTNDEGVCFSDIDDMPATPYMNFNDQQQNVDIINNGDTFELPVEEMPIQWPVEINILEFPYSVLKKMRKKCLLTNLGEDMELFLRARCYKRTRVNNDDSPTSTRQIKATRLFNCDSPSRSFETPPPSPLSYTDLLGFSECGDPVIQEHDAEDENSELADLPIAIDQNLRLSRDSGVGNELHTASPEKNIMFFPPIAEEERGQDEVQNDDIENRECYSGVQILENILLSTVKSELQSDIEINSTQDTLTHCPIVPTCDIQENHQKSLSFTVNSDKCFDDLNSTNLEEDLLESVGEKRNETTALNLNFLTNIDNSYDTTEQSNETSLDLTGDTTTKIQNWHKHLQPILASSHDRHHFDVFQIGTSIMDKFDKKENERNQFESITFQNVMEQQDQSYVSRFFLSTLLLANQGNIELKTENKNVSKPSEWHDVHLKLLSTTRHVVSMEDNIGLASTRIAIPTKISKNPTVSSVTASGSTIENSHSPPAKKRCVSTLNVNLKRVEIVKPIKKTPRTSDDYDSGIYSNDDLDNL